MNDNNPEQRFIDRLHQADDEQRPQLLCQRLLGRKGPAVQPNEAWGELTARAYHLGDAAFQPRFGAEVLDIIAKFARPSHFAQADHNDDQWRLLVAALDLTADIDWRDATLRRDLSSFLRSWIDSLADHLPRPRDLWQEQRLQGYPHQDLAAAVLRLTPDLLAWDEKSASALWSSCLRDDPAAATPAHQRTRTRAERLWWLANWALHGSGMDELKWLGQRIDPLSQALEAADWWPGDLTRLFIDAELAAGAARVAQLITRVPDPDAPERRRELALQLDYFAEEKMEIRSLLIQMRNETAQTTERPASMIVTSPIAEPATTDTEAQTMARAASARSASMDSHHAVDPNSFASRLAPANTVH